MENIDIIIEDRVIEVVVTGGRGPAGVVLRNLTLKALLTQTGTNAPVVTILENNFTEPWVFGRNPAAGNYYATNNQMALNRTLVTFTLGVSTPGFRYSCNYAQLGTLTELYTFNHLNAPSDGIMTRATLIIEVI